MNTSYSYESSARWTAGRNGVVKGHQIEPAITFSSPPEFQGEAGVWTPEHFFTAAVATCFIATFQAIASFSKFCAAGFSPGQCWPPAATKVARLAATLARTSSL